MQIIIFNNFINKYNLENICKKYNYEFKQLEYFDSSKDPECVPHALEKHKPNETQIKYRLNILQTNVKIFFDLNEIDDALDFVNYLESTGDYVFQFILSDRCILRYNKS